MNCTYKNDLELIFSPLEHLRSAFAAAKEEHQELFTPRRTLPLVFGKANIVTFACHDTRLLVGFEQGAVVIYDTAALFTSGSGDVQPLKITQLQSGPLRQIVPNPGAEQNLSSLVVVVGDGKVALLDMQLEPQGGWTASDSSTRPVAGLCVYYLISTFDLLSCMLVAWSPKGKHLAIGLQTGDILTFSLNNRAVPHKYIPPTADAILVSLNWLGPGHTFRTSYGAKSDAPPRQHIITLDTRSSTAAYFAPDHPFPSFERNQQSAYIMYLPRWDEDASGEGNKSLTVVGDVSSVDLEVLGNVGNEWHRQSQENPLTLPLDKSMDDTMLLALDVDLIDATGTPVMYAYLNDGTLQGWQVKHSKPYIGMVSTQGLAPSFSQSSIQSEDPSSKDSDMAGLSSTTETSSFAQSSSNDTPFGQQQSTFGQSPFGQQPSQNASVFGQSSFGQLSSSGSPLAFSSPGSFGQAGQTNTTTSFGSSGAKPSPGFGAFSNVSSNIFGSGLSPGGAFGNLNSGTTNAFGQGSFGTNNVNSGNVSTSQPSDMTREASMSDSTDGFGGMSLGSATSTNSNTVNSMFGSFAGAPVGAPAQSAFGGMIQPATGFGAFNNAKSSNNFDLNKPATTVTAFSAAQTSTSSGFGQSGFASPAFGKSSFGQPAFGKPGLGITPSTSASGFTAFANTPGTFGSTSTPAKTSVFGSPETQAASSGTTSGFNAFASGAPTTFGSALEASKGVDDKKDSGGAFSSFSSTTPATFASALGTANNSKPSPGGFGAFAAAAPVAFGTTPVASTALENTPKASSSTGGFTSFTSTSSTTFGTALKGSESPARTSVFGTPTGSKSFSTTSDPPSASPTIKPTPFGDSALTRNITNTPTGSPQSAFAISPPSSPEPGVRGSPYANSTPSTPRIPPAPSSNAFSNIQATPSTFKLTAGFGAFGSVVTPSSPFFKKPDDKPSVSAFSSIPPQPTSSTTPMSTPTFGSPSALGGQKSVFAPVSPQSPTVLKSTTSDGFGAFSGRMEGGFSAFAGPKKSFSELLKTGDPDPVKPSSLASSTPSSKDLPEEKTTPKSVISGSPSTPSDSSNKDDTQDDRQQTPKSVFSVLSASSPVKGPVNKVDKGKVTSSAVDDKKPLSTNVSSGTLSDEPSYGTISGSSASSFVDVKAERGSDGDTEEDAADNEGDDDVNAFLSEDASSDGSYGESAEESAAEDSEARDSPPPEPAAIPLPISRSPSATPQPEVPTIEISPSPPSEEKSYRSSSLSPAREPSTTPPGTPAKESKSLAGSSPSLSSNTPITPFGIGLGRPSTRPTRSSPLANAVLSGHDDEDEDKAKSSQPPTVAPKPAFNTLPVKTDSSEAQSPTDKRPKTPPLLSTMSGTLASTSSSDASKSSIMPAESSLAKVNAPVPLPFSFQKPAPSASPSSVFGKPSQTPSPGPSPFPVIPDAQRPATAPTLTQPNFFGTSPSPSITSLPNASMFNLPPVNPKASMATISVPQGPAVIKPSAFPQIPKSISGPMGPPSFFGAPSQPPPSQGATLKAPPADLFALSPAFSAPHKPSPAISAQAALEEGMQKECIYSVNLADKELEEVSISNSHCVRFVCNISLSPSDDCGC